mgnify:CR=1 FL=1
MYEVTVKTQFSAAHRLRGYDGKFENLHGHNWIAIGTVQARELDAMGVGIDFVMLKERMNKILSKLDYTNINDVPPFDEKNPSVENIAKWLYDELSQVVNTATAKVSRVEVKEFENCGAVYFE